MRLLTLLPAALVALAGVAQADLAQAQTPPSGQAAGLRYLGWSGKPAAAPSTEATTRAPLRPASAPAAAPAPSRPAPRIIPHGGAPATTSPNTLTSADAWLRPQPAPQPEPQPERPPAPVASDPMAPRPDALVFRSAQASATAPAPAAPVAASTSGSRYYSVHRAYGRQPDRIATPAPVYLDALPVELNQAPQSTDLAEPPAAPTVLRDANGRIRPAAPVPGEDVS